MTTATKPTFPKKNIWHSELARAGRLMVKFKSGPRESKYPDKPDYIYFQAAGDDTEYCLNIEPGTEDAFHNVPQGQWVYVEALGVLKDDPKAVHISDEAGPVLPGEDVVEPQPMYGPPPMFPEDASAPKTSGGPVDTAVSMTLAAVRGLEAGGVRVDSDAAARIYNTHFIQTSR